MGFPANSEMLTASVAEGLFKQKFGDMLDYLRLRIWTSATAVTEGDTVQPTSGSKKFMYEVLLGGTTGAIEPTWPEAENSVVDDNGVLWVCKKVAGSSGGGGAAVGLGNYIAEAFSVIPGTGLEVLINPNRCIIDETLVESATQSAFSLTAKAAQLIFKKKDGTYDKRLPKMSAVDIVDANTLCLWFPDGSSAVANSAVGVNGNTLAISNDLVKSGTVASVDGWAGGNAAKANGTDGKYLSTNYSNFPSGAQPFEVSTLFTCASIGGAYRALWSCGPNVSYTAWLVILASGNLEVGGASYDTLFKVEEGRTYLATAQYDGVSHHLLIDGKRVFSVVGSSVFGATLFGLFCFASVPNRFSHDTIHMVELRNALRTPEQLVALAQKLLIPCSTSGASSQVSLSAGMLSQSGLNTYNASQLVDGNIATHGFDITNIAAGSYIQISFSVETRLSELRLRLGNAYTTNKVKPVGSFDGVNWFDIGEPIAATALVGWFAWPIADRRAWKYYRLAWVEAGPATSPWIEELQAWTSASSDLRDSLDNPSESAIIAFCETSSTGIKKIVGPDDPNGATPDWAYGIRIGLGGKSNRRKFLGWQYYANSATYNWKNPFGSSRLSARFAYAQTAQGMNEFPITHQDNGSYGISPRPLPGSYIRMAVIAAIYAFGAWQTTGYIGAYVEVFDD